MADFTYDLSTNIGKLRLEIPDTNDTTFVYTDDELQYFLDKADDDIQWARVFVYENRCALESGLTGKEVEVGDIRIKGSGEVGANWCLMATTLRKHLESGSKESSIDLYSYTGGIYKSDRIADNQAVEDGTLLERDFYDYYNESGERGGLIDDTDTSD